MTFFATADDLSTFLKKSIFELGLVVSLLLGVVKWDKSRGFVE